mmetsp:Transcript_40152/g.99226  ORF Transcript_40152/g.99226 Transcript_40152/m.99226 type:complete len:112 (+) Transcript_40152:340-675(+)
MATQVARVGSVAEMRTAYFPLRPSSCRCVPSSSTRPSPTKAILSALRMVDSLCAITIVVRFCAAITASNAACTTRSLSLSSAEVASSSNKIVGFFKSARAMAMRCFCPPES